MTLRITEVFALYTSCTILNNHPVTEINYFQDRVFTNVYFHSKQLNSLSLSLFTLSPLHVSAYVEAIFRWFFPRHQPEHILPHPFTLWQQQIQRNKCIEKPGGGEGGLYLHVSVVSFHQLKYNSFPWKWAGSLWIPSTQIFCNFPLFFVVLANATCFSLQDHHQAIYTSLSRKCYNYVTDPLFFGFILSFLLYAIFCYSSLF
jgi:hypothetical protein